MKYLKRFNESLSPIELLKSDKYNKITFDEFELSTRNFEEFHMDDVVDESDIKFIKNSLNGFGNHIKGRYIMGIDPVKRYHTMDFYSAITVDLKSIKNNRCEDYFVFYKFKDEIWIIEVQLFGDHNTYICDGRGGIKSLIDKIFSVGYGDVLNESVSNSDKPYWRIREEEYDDVDKYPNVDISNRLYNQIKNFASGNDVKIDLRDNSMGKTIFINRKEVKYEINKILDDYFLVKCTEIHPTSVKYYKCDQIEGLFEFIKHYNLITDIG